MRGDAKAVGGGETAGTAAAQAALRGRMAGGSGGRRRCDDDLDAAALVIQVVAYAAGLDAETVADPGRHGAPAARARQIAMYLLHTLYGWPLWRVGQAFGRDRTTAGYACTLIESLRDDRAFDAEIEALETCLRAAPAPGVLA
jgi:hypothetical protein